MYGYDRSYNAIIVIISNADDIISDSDYKRSREFPTLETDFIYLR